MTVETIKKLNEVNTDFYVKTAQFFSNTRQYAWKGWEILWEYLQSTNNLPSSVLDVGCGNGRFASFLKNNINSFEYSGFDSSKELISIAKEQQSKSNISFHVADLLDETHFKTLPKYDLIVLFGVLHHVPGFSSRVKLIKSLKSHLTTNRMIALSAWDFMKQDRFKNKISDWSKVGIDESDIEKNDFLLTWEKGVLAYRYAHHTTTDEMSEISRLADIDLAHSFYADGKSQDLNQYFLLQ